MFFFIIISNVMYSCDGKAEFSAAITLVFMIRQNHSNMFICCTKNISSYYQWLKQLCCLMFFVKTVRLCFRMCLRFFCNKSTNVISDAHLLTFVLFIKLLNTEEVLIHFDDPFDHMSMW